MCNIICTKLERLVDFQPSLQCILLLQHSFATMLFDLHEQETDFLTHAHYIPPYDVLNVAIFGGAFWAPLVPLPCLLSSLPHV
jgi:hypothetical protein